MARTIVLPATFFETLLKEGAFTGKAARLLMRQLNIVGGDFRRVHYFVIPACRRNRWATMILDTVHGTLHCFESRASNGKEDGVNLLSGGDGSWRARLSSQGDGSVHATRPEAVESFGRIAGVPASRFGISDYFFRLVFKWYHESFKESLTEADTPEGMEAIDTHGWIGMRYMGTASSGPASPLPVGYKEEDFVTMHAGFPHSHSLQGHGLHTMVCLRAVALGHPTWLPPGIGVPQLQQEAIAIITGMGQGGDSRLFKKNKEGKPRIQVTFHEAWVFEPWIPGKEDWNKVKGMPPGRLVLRQARTEAHRPEDHNCSRCDRHCKSDPPDGDDGSDSDSDPENDGSDDEDDPSGSRDGAGRVHRHHPGKEKKNTKKKKKKPGKKTLVTIVSHNIGGGSRVGFRENYPVVQRLYRHYIPRADIVCLQEPKASPGSLRTQARGATLNGTDFMGPFRYAMSDTRPASRTLRNWDRGGVAILCYNKALKMADTREGNSWVSVVFTSQGNEPFAVINVYNPPKYSSLNREGVFGSFTNKLMSEVTDEFQRLS
jgi:hypothetical protein